jgi:hypothetical protein
VRVEPVRRPRKGAHEKEGFPPETVVFIKIVGSAAGLIDPGQRHVLGDAGRSYGGGDERNKGARCIGRVRSVGARKPRGIPDPG